MNENIPTQQEEAGIGKFERQMERSQLFTYTALGKSFAQTEETSAFVHGLIDLLLSKGLIEEGELKTAIVDVQQQMIDQNERTGPGTIIRPEENSEPVNDLVQVDCDTRMHICKAVCCKLNFALSVSEIESGKIKWDLGRPYFIRHETDGYCTHVQRSCGKCGIYEHRPAICRRYSCANDSRIWKDFQKMELNTEWLSSNLPPDVEERRIGTVM